MHTKNVIKPEFQELITILEKHIEMITSMIIEKYDNEHSLMKIREPYKFDSFLHQAIHNETKMYIEELVKLYMIGTYTIITFEEGEKECFQNYLRMMNS